MPVLHPILIVKQILNLQLVPVFVRESRAEAEEIASPLSVAFMVAAEAARHVACLRIADSCSESDELEIRVRAIDASD